MNREQAKKYTELCKQIPIVNINHSLHKLIAAFANGAEIEELCEDGYWFLNPNPSFQRDEKNYRIRKCVPFTYETIKPCFHVEVCRRNELVCGVIMAANDSGVYVSWGLNEKQPTNNGQQDINVEFYTYQKLFEEVKFLVGGSPCGKVEPQDVDSIQCKPRL